MRSFACLRTTFASFKITNETNGTIETREKMLSAKYIRSLLHNYQLKIAKLK